MNTDKAKGAMDDAVGRAKRQAGEWTGDTKTQAEGAAQQIKGKAEKAWGTVKDAAHDAKTDAEREQAKKEQAQKDREHEREHARSHS
ncbi:MAG: CsbD family protein [Terracidiphilus sp.]